MSARMPAGRGNGSNGLPVGHGVDVSGPGMAWWVPDVGRIWCSAAMRPLAASVAVVTATVLAVTLVPDPAMASPVSPDAGGSGLGAGQTPFQFGPDAAGGGELVADDEIGAVVQSRATGRRVEILSSRTETSRTWVNPEGTWTTEQAAGPVRFVDRAGVWQDIDLDLEVDDTGAVAPEAHPLDLGLPAGDAPAPPPAAAVSEAVGGQAPAGSVPVQALAPVTEPTGEQVQLGWPGELPEPVLDGPVATYEDVTAGVDLQVKATTTGFETFMVVNDRPQAGEALSWTLPVDLDGVEAVERADGAVEFVSTGTIEGGVPAGEVVSLLPPAYAWDAQVDEKAQIPTNDSDVDLSVVDLPDGGQAVQVTPDQAWLQDPATEYPVTVDPAYASSRLTSAADTYVQSDISNNRGGETELRVGTYNGGAAVARSYLAFDIPAIRGLDIRSAELSLRNTYSWSCSPAGWEAWSSSGFTESTMTWANRAAPGTLQGSTTATAGYSSACPADRTTIDITAMARTWALDTVNSRKFVMIKAVSETSSSGWKKFASRETTTPPYVNYTYNRAPAVPVPSTSSGVAYPGTATPYVATRTPVLTAKPTDPDANTVKVDHQVHSGTAGTAASLLASCTTPFVASGTNASCTSTTALPDNTRVYVRAKATDQVGASSAWSGWYSFVITTTTPLPPTITCPNYPTNSWTTAAPTADLSCTVTGAGPSSGTEGQASPGYIRYSVDAAPEQRVQITPSDSTTTSRITVTVPRQPNGRHSITARTESRSGRISGAVTWVADWGPRTSGGSAPTTPDSLAVLPCASSCETPAMTREVRPTLSAQSSDVDNDPVTLTWQVFERNPDQAQFATLVASSTTPPGAPGTTQLWPPVVDLEPGDYEYRVQAWDGVHSSAWSAPFPFSVDLMPALGYSTNASGAVTLTWDAVETTGQYTLYRDDIQLATTTATTYVDNTAEQGRLYNYSVDVVLDDSDPALGDSDGVDGEVAEEEPSVEGEVDPTSEPDADTTLESIDDDPEAPVNAPFEDEIKPEIAVIMTAPVDTSTAGGPQTFGVASTSPGSSFKVVTFIPAAKPQAFPCTGNTWDDMYFAGNNRSYDSTSISYKTYLRANVDWNTRKVTQVKKTPDTKLYYANGTLKATRNAGTADYNVYSTTVGSTSASLKMKHEATNPFCPTKGGAIAYNFSVTLKKDGRYSILGTHRQVPSYEIYHKKPGTTKWSTVYQKKILSFGCLHPNPACPIARVDKKG